MLALPTVAQIVAWEVIAFLLALFGMVAGQLFTGQISTKNLLYGRKNDADQPFIDADGTRRLKKENSLYFSPERVQLLMFTLSAAFYYLTQVMNNSHPGILPDVPKSWTETMGGSNAIYLGGKALARFWPRNDAPNGNVASTGERQ
jgi:hypothetical protein